MYAFVVFAGLALALAVVGEVLNEILPVKAPKALTTSVSVGVAMLVSWALNYSVFRAFGQPLRAEWMNPVATGVVLVGMGQLIRQVVANLGLNISVGGRSKTA
ncbi:MAG TPA: hypothetical protein VHB69_14145 [Mycobacteriales bacterium]|nr:hypothetical protein [Mycobacteriales bacterium]